jgi:hypothetical protein
LDRRKYIFMVLDAGFWSSCYDKLPLYAEVIEQYDLTSRDDVAIMIDR